MCMCLQRAGCSADQINWTENQSQTIVSIVLLKTNRWNIVVSVFVQALFKKVQRNIFKQKSKLCVQFGTQEASKKM